MNKHCKNSSRLLFFNEEIMIKYIFRKCSLIHVYILQNIDTQFENKDINMGISQDSGQKI